MSELAAHPIAHHGASYGTAHHEPDPGGLNVARLTQQVPGDQGPARLPQRITRENSLRRRIRDAAGSIGGHRASRNALERPADERETRCRTGEPSLTPGPGRSDTDPHASLTAPCGEYRAPRAGPHPQPEPVRLRAMAVVRLERTLAHWDSRYTGQGRCGRSPPRRFDDAGLMT